MSKKTSLPSGSSMSGHSLAFSIMRICGIDPVAAVDGKSSWPEGYVPDYVENDRGTLRMRIALDGRHDVQVVVNGDDARVSARGQSFPESAHSGLIGLPISQIVDHVLFTGSNARVKEVSSFVEEEDGLGTHFVLNEDSQTFTAP